MKGMRAVAHEARAEPGGGGYRAFVPPCLATPVTKPPTGRDWIAEIKYDGYRIQAHIASGQVRLLTRSGHDWTEKLGSLPTELADLPVASAIIDGEAIVENADGVPDFHALQREIKKGAAARIALMAFDLLELDGMDMRGRPLRERKRALSDVIGACPGLRLLRFSAHFEDAGDAVMRNVCALGLEGIVCKRANLPYRSGRSGDWVKVKCVVSETFVVCGYVPLRGAEEAVGSLALGYFEDGALRYAGRVGTGFTVAAAHDIWVALQTVRRKRPPFAQPLTREQLANAAWVEPRLAVEITHRGWTQDDILRHAVFTRFRLDLAATDVGVPASRRSSG